MTRRLMLLDTASLYFRAFYGVPDTVRASDGTPVNAVRGLLDFLASGESTSRVFLVSVPRKIAAMRSRGRSYGVFWCLPELVGFLDGLWKTLMSDRGVLGFAIACGE